VSFSLYAGIALLGGFGAACRFLLDGAVSARSDTSFPTGTFTVNVLGALVLGVLVGLEVPENLIRLFALGALGGFTTFSTWVFETHRLAEDGLLRVALANIFFSLAAGIAAVWLGKVVGGLF
jgi:CrcB protein